MLPLDDAERDVLMVLGRRKHAQGHVDEVCRSAKRPRSAFDKLVRNELVRVEGAAPPADQPDKRTAVLTEQGREAVNTLLTHGRGETAEKSEAAEPRRSRQPAPARELAPGLTTPQHTETGLFAYLRERADQSAQRPRVTIYTELGKTAGALTVVGADFVGIRREDGVEQLYPREAIIHIDLPWSEDA